jgi:hypothetical protein
MTADGELTFAGDSYTGTMKMATPQGNMSTVYCLRFGNEDRRLETDDIRRVTDTSALPLVPRLA